VVGHAELFKDGDELLDWRKLQHQALAVRRRYACILEELRAGDVAALVILLIADLQEDERSIVEMVGEPIDSDQHGFARRGGRNVRAFILSDGVCSREEEKPKEKRYFFHVASLAENFHYDVLRYSVLRHSVKHGCMLRSSSS